MGNLHSYRAITRLLAIAALLLVSLGAHASSLSIAGGTPITFTGYNGQPASVTGTYTSGQLGTLVALAGGTFSATYLGQESGYFNQFKFLEVQGLKLTELDALGKTISKQVGAGVLGFKFWDSKGAVVKNGVDPKTDSSTKNDYASFAILGGKCTNYGCFDYILGFNDGYKFDADYDDFVVGVRLSPVPLPAAAWLFGSALIGFMFVSNRRRV